MAVRVPSNASLCHYVTSNDHKELNSIFFFDSLADEVLWRETNSDVISKVIYMQSLEAARLLSCYCFLVIKLITP